MTKIQKISIRFLKIFFIIICLIIIFNMIKPDTPLEKTIKKQKINEKNARIECIVGIQKKLKYPDSMEIINRSVLNTGKNKWIVRIKIKAKNSFNLMVSSNFICDVCRVNEKYKLKRIKEY